MILRLAWQQKEAYASKPNETDVSDFGNIFKDNVRAKVVLKVASHT